MGTVKLVACVAGKLPVPAPARDLYQSQWFKAARRYAEQGRWFVLSAKHGLIDPSTVIEPYEMTLNNMPRDDRMAWAERVMDQVRRAIPEPSRMEILAGLKYREHLVPLLKASGYRVHVPMQGLGIGKQMQWLNRESKGLVQMTDLLAW